MPAGQTTVAPHIFVQSSNLFQVNSVVIGGSTATLVVDPAWYPDELENLRSRIATSPVGHATHLALTHCDADHVGRINDFADLPIIASPQAPDADWANAAHFVNETDATQVVHRDGYYTPPSRDRLIFTQELDLGDEPVHFFPVSGHTPNSLFLVLPRQRLLIAGDYLHDILSPIVRTSLADYRAALMKALEICDRYDIDTLVPGHGRVVTGGAAIRMRAAVDIDYVDRLEAALRKAATEGLSVDETVTQLQDFAYGEHGLTPYMAHWHAANVRRLLPAIKGK